MTVAPVAIEAPSVAPALGGLLSVADIIDASDPHVAFGIEYQSFLCGTGGVTEGCVPAPEGLPVDAPKRFSGSETVTGAPVSVYAGVACDLFGAPYDTQARDRLAGAEERLVGTAFYRYAVAPGWASGEAPVFVGAEITTDNVVEAIARLEQYAGEMYAGTPILHMNRYTATLAISADVVAGSLDGSLMTVQGTPVANSPGYPDGVVFVTGAVHMWRTPVQTFDATGTTDNQHYSLAERTYVVSTDCLLAVAGDDVPPADITITDITPDTVSVGELGEFTITGTGFTAEMTVTVDGQEVGVDVLSDTEATFEWSSDVVGEHTVVVSDGQSQASTTITVEAVGVAPTITAVTPDTGPLAGGVTITITGTGFEE